MPGLVEVWSGILELSDIHRLPRSSFFTAELTDEDGNPVLRMYEYERVRQVEYQMDFWLGENDHHLNCRMRIVNSGKEVVPMYWWSNMAVPEYDKGRVIVPASKAFTSDAKDVKKGGHSLCRWN